MEVIKDEGLDRIQTGEPAYRELNLAIDEMAARITDPTFRQRFIFGADKLQE